jgi:hypothetical protein
LKAVASLPVALRSDEKIWVSVVPVTVAPFWLMQLLNAAMAEALTPWNPPPKPSLMPAGAYFAQSLKAVAFAPPANPPGRLVNEPVGRGRGEAVENGWAPLVRNAPGWTFTPCAFRQDWKAAVEAEDVDDAEGLAVAPVAATGVLLLEPPQAVRARHAAAAMAARPAKRKRFMYSP